MPSKRFSFRRRRGSIYILVLIFAGIFGSLIWNALAIQRHQMVLNQQQIMRNQARLINESLVRMASLQLSAFFENGINTLPGTSPSVTVPYEELEKCLDPHLRATLVRAETEVVIDRLKAPVFHFIDPDIPGRETRQLLGSTVSAQDVPIYAKVTLVGPMDTKVTVYAEASYELLASPLFGFSMFFNQKMESSAGADLTVIGAPIYINGDFMQSTRGDLGSLHIYAPMTLVRGRFLDDDYYGDTWGGYVAFPNAKGVFYNTTKDNYTKTIAGTTYKTNALKIPTDIYGNARSYASLQNSRDTFTDNAEGYLSWMDRKYNENDKDWYNISLYNWDGMLKTQAHNVQQMSVPGMDTYNFVKNPKSDQYVNTAYQIIQPLRNNNDPAFNSATNAELAQKNRVREQNKYSYKANLIIKLEEKTVGANTTYEVDPTNMKVSYWTPARDSNGNLVYNGDGTPKLTSVGLPSGLVEVVPYTPETQTVKKNGKWVTQETGYVTSGLYDNRREEGVNLVKLNVGRLRELTDGHASASGTKFTQDPGASSLTDNNGWWNGGVYVEFPVAKTNPRTGSSGPAADGVQPSIKNYGLYVHNGEYLPKEGLTIATNNAMYVAGHFNANGTITADSNSKPDRTTEAPASLVADAVTILSSNWEANNNAYRSKKAHQDRPAAHTEISAAILTGFAPSYRETSTGSGYSGSMANFIRYLEDWGYYLSDHRDLAIRGSQVCLFDSEVAEEHWHGNSNVYWPPDRLFGYNTMFNTRMPPLTPITPVSGPAFYREIAPRLWADEVAAIRTGL
ncbi:MAG: hypothetical protein Q7P63_17565 [Verrucomicrobiota bacterium JB022]|nr:hypothetical protein [Verrucomicrobiota bacterium JB022]